MGHEADTEREEIQTEYWLENLCANKRIVLKWTD